MKWIITDHIVKSLRARSIIFNIDAYGDATPLAFGDHSIRHCGEGICSAERSCEMGRWHNTPSVPVAKGHAAACAFASRW